MSRVVYNGSRLIPAPRVSINKTFDRAGDEIIGSRFTITLTGFLVAFKGSPRSGLDGTVSDVGFGGFDNLFWQSSAFPPDETIGADSRLAAITRKINAIKALFKKDDQGKTFEIQSDDATAPLKANVRIIDIVFQEESPVSWYDKCPYTITLEADNLFLEGNPLGEDEFDQHISQASESWSIDTDEGLSESTLLPRTYRFVHTLSATGKRHYDDTGALQREAWEQAKEWVLPRLGFDASFASSSGVINLPAYYQGFNHIRNENTDEITGTYSVTEQFLLASGTSLETFNVSVRQSRENGTELVTIDGNITGLEERDVNLGLTTSKFTNADTKWTTVSGLAFSRAQNHATETLNTISISQLVGKNEIAGTINYSFEYDNRPSNCIPGAKSESIVITDNLTADVFAAITVLGRAAGPVLQSINTITAPTRSLSLEVVVDPVIPADCTSANLHTAMNNNPRINPATSSEVNAIIAAANPTIAGFAQVFVSSPQETWDFRSGRYTYSAQWTYQ